MSILSRLGLFLALTLSAGAMAMNQGLYFHNQSLRLQSDRPEDQRLKLRPDGTLRVMEKFTFNQKLNHASTEAKTFKQRYFVDSQYATGLDAPVFYIICGEWNCAGTASYSFVEGLAKKFKAHLIALEHRYYGESLPTTNLTTGNLSYLRLSFAVEDLAKFQRFMVNTKGYKGPWVAFGGSYAGTLAAYYRFKHPELVIGALASSAPVFAKTEFNEYDAHIAKVVNRSSCGDKIREAVGLIEKRLETPEGSRALKELFRSSDIPDDEDFLYAVADMVAAAVQYGRDKVFCDAIDANQDVVEGYAKGGLAVLSSMGAKPSEIALSSALKVDVTPSENMRQWMWQSCQEFGWFQVANGEGRSTSRSLRVNLDYHQRICKRLYNVRLRADGSINRSWYFPMLDPKTSRIIFTNGSNDPWLTLSVVPKDEPAHGHFDLLMMEGAAHCNDLRAVTQLPSVMEAQLRIEGIVADWLR